MKQRYVPRLLILLGSGITAIAALAQDAAPSAPTPETATPAPPARIYLTKTELEQTLVGKAHVFKNLSSGYLFRWDLRTGGQLYYNSLSFSNTGGNGSGTWEVNDNGGLCVKWNRAESGNAGCNYYYRDGDKLLRAGSTRLNAVANAQVEKIE